MTQAQPERGPSGSRVRIPWTEIRILDVWRELGGGEIKRNRARAFWRNGDGWNVSLRADKDAWFDFASGSGGGVLNLVETALRCDRRTALEWIAERWGTPDDGLPVDYRARAKLCDYSELWRRGRVRELERLKAEALAICDKGGRAAWPIFTEAAAELYQTETAGPESVVAMFDHALIKDATGACHLIHDQQRHESEAANLAGFIVAALAHSERRKAAHAA